MDGSHNGTITTEVDATNKEIFDFFGLPRELRNQIYADLAVDFVCPGVWRAYRYGNQLRVIKHNAPSSRHLVVSRQFGTEYKQQLLPLQTLGLRDIDYGDYRTREISGPHELLGSSFIADAFEATKAKMQLLSCAPDQYCFEQNWRDALCDIDDHCISIDTALDGIAQIQQVEIELFIHSSALESLRWSQRAELAQIMQHIDKSHRKL
ncbi:hypothetical protein LTR37_003512 [Vermiconidia calcicola]|uniref:Uncharacterized protein n=1 Tax=Vermiconidia calcicola TaxID=1690605 RepID=A0ACC3NPM1_9PEZI|nr:hypothetical protein LTR37_003512 [Vermiconidia calcicola]